MVLSLVGLSNIPAAIEILSVFLILKKILAPHLLQKPLFAFFEDLNHLRFFLLINLISLSFTFEYAP